MSSKNLLRTSTAGNIDTYKAQSLRFLSLHCTHPRPKASMSAPSLTHFITKRPWLKRWMTPLAHWYADAAGYRKLGLRYDTFTKPNHPFCSPNLFFIIPHCDAQKKIQKAPPFELLWLIDFCYKKTNKKRADDLIPEESNTVMLALKRLPPKEAYDRVFRLRRAFQVYMFPPRTLFFS